jgi:hypothetical protein
LATIRERKGRFGVKISRNRITICQTFSTLETAKLWAAYKEDLLDEMEAFNPPKQEMITLEDAINFKIDNAIKDGLSTRSVTDIKNLKIDFNAFLQKYMHEISYDDLIAHCKKMSKIQVKFGGSVGNEKSGKYSMPSPITIINKLKRLSTVYSNLNENNVDIDNIALKCVNELSKNLRK